MNNLDHAIYLYFATCYPQPTNDRITATRYIYLHGHGSGEVAIQKDKAEAARLFKLAAQKGHATAQFNLATMYKQGEGVSQDYVEGLRWLQMSASQGYRRALFSLGWMYQHGVGGVCQDSAAAAKQYKEAAVRHDPEAQVNLAIMLLKGECESDLHRVKEQQRMQERQHAAAIRAGATDAVGGVGGARGDGDGVGGSCGSHIDGGMRNGAGGGVADKVDGGGGAADTAAVAAAAVTPVAVPTVTAPAVAGRTPAEVRKEDAEEEAALFFRKAAELGHSAGQHGLAYMHTHGKGAVPQDHAEAFRLHLLAAEQGYLPAAVKVGRAYKDGLPAGIVEQDLNQARKWLRFAVEKGSASAECHLALLLKAHGSGSGYSNGGGGGGGGEDGSESGSGVE